MIIVTRLDRSRFGVNPDLIERVHASPDTTLHMVDGNVYVIAESLGTLVDLIVAYRARVLQEADAMIRKAVD
ncbi:MAG: flagellar FlbD family protein [Microbacterium sp.]|nr:flagellar FlbD family protein [Microbacterium sp.]